MRNLTAVYQKRKNFYIGWIEELPGVNTQGKTLLELRRNLREAFDLIVSVNRNLSISISANEPVIREVFN